MRRADRLFQIVQHLRARRLTTAAQLSEFLGVSTRTIYRDIADLSQSGIPINGEAGVGYAVDRSFELTALMFSREEVESVVVGLRMTQAFCGPLLRTAAVSALDKVILAMPQSRRAEVEKPQIYAPAFGTPPVTLLVESLRQAIDDHAGLRITYAASQARPAQRIVQPLALHFWGAVWTLAAYCELRSDFRTFRLDRISVFERTGTVFEEQPGRTLQDYLRHVGANPH